MCFCFVSPSLNSKFLESNWEQLQKDRQADKQRQQALSNSVAMAVQSKVEKCIKSEVKTSFLPGRSLVRFITSLWQSFQLVDLHVA